MIRPASCVLLLLAAGAGAALFHVSFDVSALDDRLTELNRGIVADQEALHVLRAEWSFLNQPARLEELSQRYLDLQPLDGVQIGSVAALPVRLPGPDDVPAIDMLDDMPGTTALALLIEGQTGPRPRLKPQAPARDAAPVISPGISPGISPTTTPAALPAPVPVALTSAVPEDSVSTITVPAIAEPAPHNSPMAPGGGAIPIAARSLDDVLADLTRMGGLR